MDSLKNLALEYTKQRKYNKSIEIYRVLKKIDQGSDYDIYIGSNYFQMSDYEKSLYYLHRALARRNGQDVSSIVSKICLSYIRLGRFIEAKQFTLEQLKITRNYQIIQNLLDADSIFFTSKEIEDLEHEFPENFTPETKRILHKKKFVLLNKNEIKNFISKDCGGREVLKILISSGFIQPIDSILRNGNKKEVESLVPIFTFWDKKPAREEIIDNVETWANYSCCKNLIVSDEEAEAYLQDNFDKEISQIYRSSRHAAMKSDIYRYCRLYVEGGMYIDADYKAGFNFKNLLNFIEEEKPEHLVHLLQFDGRLTISNALIYADSPKSKWLEKVIENIKARHLKKLSINDVTGPGVFTDSLVDILKYSFDYLYNVNYISRSAIDLVLPTGNANYKKEKEFNWRNF